MCHDARRSFSDLVLDILSEEFSVDKSDVVNRESYFSTDGSRLGNLTGHVSGS